MNIDISNGVAYFMEALPVIGTGYLGIFIVTAVIIAVVSGGGHCLLRQWILGDIRKTPSEIADILCKIIRLPNHMDISDETTQRT